MSSKAATILLIAPAMLVGSAARAQSSDKSPAESKDQAAQPEAEAPAKEPTPPAEPPPEPKKAAPALKNPWFVRPSFDVSSGNWKLTVYGFAEVDVMNDSTRSFADGMNSNVLAHDGTQAGTMGRTQMTIRNTRIGVKASAPEFGGVKSSGVVEGDFFGYDPNPAPGGTPTPTGAASPSSEAGFFNNPTWRIRHAYVKLESDVVDLLFGQSYHVLGWQNYFFQTSLAFLGLPSELFGRTPQARLSHSFKSDAVTFDMQVAAFRPVQRDSSIPDGEAGLRLLINDWKGISTPGNGGTAAFPAAIGVSGLIRRFKVDQFAATPTVGASSSDTGWAVAVDALIPVIPAADSTDRGNALTLTGEFTLGSGDADQFTGMTAGASNRLPVGATSGPDIDNGLVTYDASGILHTIPWQTFAIGLQYYVPPTGRMIVAANYNQADSNKMADLYPNAKGVFKASRYVDGSVFFDVTPAARLGMGYQFLEQTFCDNTAAQNHRFEVLGLYFF